MRSLSVPCGVSSSSTRPALYAASKARGSSDRGYEQMILRTRPAAINPARPRVPVPALLATTVRSVAPCSSSASINSSGWPTAPNPPSSTVAPFWMPSSAAARSATCLLIIPPTLSGGLTGSGLGPLGRLALLRRRRGFARRQFPLRQHGFQSRYVLQQPLGGQPQEIKAERRVLEIQPLHLVIGDGEHYAGLDAFHARRAAVLRRQQSELAEHLAGRNRDPDLAHQKFAADDIEHLVGALVLSEQDGALLVGPLGHERLEPVHRLIGVRRFLDLLDQPPHLDQAVEVDRQNAQIQNEREIRRVEIAVGDEEQVADDADDAQRHHGLHVVGHYVEHGADEGESQGEIEIQQLVDGRVVGHAIELGEAHRVVYIHQIVEMHWFFNSVYCAACRPILSGRRPTLAWPTSHWAAPLRLPAPSAAALVVRFQQMIPVKIPDFFGFGPLTADASD